MRKAWALRFGGRSYVEIAAELKVPLGTIATWVRRIRQLATAEGHARVIR